MTGFAALTRSEARLYRRDPVLLGFAFLLPLALMLAFGLPEGSREPSPDFGGQVPIDTVLPSMALTIAFGMVGIFSLPGYLADHRSRGVLRRLSTTPAHPAALLLAELALSALMAIAAVALVLVVGAAALGMNLPDNVPGVLGVFVLGAASLFGIGLLIAAVAPDPQKAWMFGSLVFFPSLFFAGVYLPREQMGATLRQISDLTPFSAFRESLETTWTGGSPELLAIVVMAAWGAGAVALAAKAFRWE